MKEYCQTAENNKVHIFALAKLLGVKPKKLAKFMSEPKNIIEYEDDLMKEFEKAMGKKCAQRSK